jgi:hypothetical protein
VSTYRDYIVEHYGSAPPPPHDWYDRGGTLPSSGMSHAEAARFHEDDEDPAAIFAAFGAVPHGVTGRPEQRMREQIQWGLRYIREHCGRRRPTL